MTEFSMGPRSFENKPRGIGKRHMLGLMGFVGFALSYSMRFNLSIAIVAMVNNTESRIRVEKNVNAILFKTDVCSTYNSPQNDLLSSSSIIKDSFMLSLNETDKNDETETHSYYQLVNGTKALEDLNRNESVISIGRLAEDVQDSINNFSKVDKGALLGSEFLGEFNWSEADQGVILGSFFWGYILTQIPGGWVGHRFGGKWPFGIGLFLNAVLAMLTPAAAWIGGMKLVMLVRFLQGVTGGMTVPAMHGLLAKWVPPEERGKITAFVYAGMPFGSALSMIISGYIIHFVGWPFVFYASGVATIIWFALWTFLVYSSPDEHPRISQTELKYIQNSIQGSSDSHAETPKRPPWRKIIKSMPFWAVIFGQTAETWGLYTIMTEMPSYFSTVLHFDITENSLMSAFPHLLTWGVSIILTQVGDYLIEKRYASIGAVRKICNTIALWGSGGLLIGVAYSGCDRTITVTLLGLAVASLGGIYGGVLVNMIDIAPNYAGLLMGFSNTAATIPGFLAPWVAGVLLDNDPSLENWRLVLLITAAVSIFGNLLFIIFASGEEQAWNREENNDDSNGSIKTRGVVDISTFNHQFYNGPLENAMPLDIIVSKMELPDSDSHH